MNAYLDYHAVSMPVDKLSCVRMGEWERTSYWPAFLQANDQLWLGERRDLKLALTSSRSAPTEAGKRPWAGFSKRGNRPTDSRVSDGT